MVVGQLQSSGGHLVLCDDTAAIGLVVPAGHLSAAAGGIGLMDVVVLTEWSVVLPSMPSLPSSCPRPARSLEQAAKDEDGLASMADAYLQLCGACTAASVAQSRRQVSETQNLPRSLHCVLRRRARAGVGKQGSGPREAMAHHTGSAHSILPPPIHPPIHPPEEGAPPPVPACRACVIRVDHVYGEAGIRSVSYPVSARAMHGACAASATTDERRARQGVSFTVTGVLLLEPEPGAGGAAGGRQGQGQGIAPGQHKAPRQPGHRNHTAALGASMRLKGSVRFTGTAALHFPFVQVGTCLSLTAYHVLDNTPHDHQVLSAQAWCLVARASIHEQT
jgi:hypothetical protein